MISDDHSSITAKGPVSSVQVHHHMVFGPTAVTMPLDLTVLVQLMFMLAEKSRRSPQDQQLVVTPLTLLDRLRSLGIASGNGARLIGRDAVYESVDRLRRLGYIRRIEPREHGKRVGPVAYEYYENPAWNADYQAGLAGTEPLGQLAGGLESPQVGATSGNAGSGNAGSRTENRANLESPQVGATSGNAGSGNAGSSKRRSSFPQVRATSGNAVPPPHPPVGGGTSPYPLTHAASPQGVEGTRFAPTADQLAAADDFLQNLPGPWQAGAMTARKLAPLLADRIITQGLDLDADLRNQLTADTGAVKRHSSVLEYRIKDLKRRRPAAADAPAPVRLPAQDCTTCHGSGLAEDANGNPVGPCACVRTPVKA